MLGCLVFGGPGRLNTLRQQQLKLWHHGEFSTSPCHGKHVKMINDHSLTAQKTMSFWLIDLIGWIYEQFLGHPIEIDSSIILIKLKMTWTVQIILHKLKLPLRWNTWEDSMGITKTTSSQCRALILIGHLDPSPNMRQLYNWNQHT